MAQVRIAHDSESGDEPDAVLGALGEGVLSPTAHGGHEWAGGLL